MRIRLAIFFFLFVFICGAALSTAEAQTSASGPSGASGAQGSEAAVKKDTSQSNIAHPLSEAQKKAIKSIQVESEKKGTPVALRLAGIMHKIYENMLAEKPDEEVRARLSEEMKETAWELLSIKGQSIRETVNVLTPEQKQLIKAEMVKPGAPADLMEIISRTFKLADK